MYLVLQFASTMQSWGIKERWIHTRRTSSAPTKRAVAGLIGRAMGVIKEDEVGHNYIEQNLLSVTTISTTVPDRMIDDQVTFIKDYVEEGLARGLPSADGTVRGTYTNPYLSQKYTKEYLVDTISKPIVVAIEGSEDFLKEVRDALVHPVYPICFGRYCCVPAKPILVDGKIYKTLEEAKKLIREEEDDDNALCV